MKITRTPLRISLVGGGSDMPEFYKHHVGAVVSFAIDKYVWVILNSKFDGKNRVSYGETTEYVNSAHEIKHDLVRNALELYHRSGVEVVSVADIPGKGTGLGSSSSFTVGLCAALSAECNGKITSPKKLAEEAFFVEAKRAGHPVGKQDMYAASYGGFHAYHFLADRVEVTPICLAPEKLRYIQQHMMLFYTGITRDANVILHENRAHIEGRSESYIKSLEQQVILADELLYDLQSGKVSSIGRFLHKNWELKKQFSGVTTPEIDNLYMKALNAGALGGKLLGAGGGGFLLFWADPSRHDAIREALALKQVDFKIAEKGCEVIHG